MKQTRACIKISGREGRSTPGIVRELRKVNLLLCFPRFSIETLAEMTTSLFSVTLVGSRQLSNTGRQSFTPIALGFVLKTAGLKLDQTD